MTVSVIDLIKQWWVTLLVLASILGLSLMPDSLHSLLELRHRPVQNGEWWRLYTCHFVHLSFNHTLLNLAGYSIVAFSFREEISALRELTMLAIATSAVGFGIYYLNPEMYSYVGLSGAIYGVLVAFVIIGYNQTPLIASGFLGFIVIKFIYEAAIGGASPETEAFIGGKVASDSHLYGALSGILPGLIWFWQDRRKLRFYDTTAFVNQFREGIVRDLAWVLHSAPLLSINQSDYRTFSRREWARIARDFQDQLVLLDKNPKPLIDEVQPEKLRLGWYFEALIGYWLRHQSRYTLLHHGLKVQDGTRTIGEFDFIVRDNQTGQVQHWEAAVKFYLGVRDYSDASLWFGPGKKDRFDIKLSHLTGKQIRLSEDPHGKATLQQHNLQIHERRLLVKGRLFYPARARHAMGTLQHSLAPDHLKGRWYKVTDVLQATSARALGFGFRQSPRFHIADKEEWFVLKTEPNMDLEELKTFLKLKALNRPVTVIATLGKTESKRFFVVPDNWETELAITG